MSSPNKKGTSSSGGGGGGGGGRNSHSNKKRKFIGGGKRKQFSRNPKRGGPGILLTCETGREHKCKMQGLDILKHYVLKSKISASSSTTNNNNDNNNHDTDEEDTSLSLEDELKKLQSKNNSKNQGGGGSAATEYFSAYETGCRGNILLLCTMESSHLIPPIKTEYIKSKEAAADEDTNNEDGEKKDVDAEGEKEESPKKKPRLTENEINMESPRKEEEEAAKNDEKSIQSKSDEKNDQESTEPSPPPWDPIETVRRIMADNENKSSDAPSSRFITRMIPIQATCFASTEELKLTTQALVKKYLPPTASTFAIESKRRNCNNLTRESIIETVAEEVLAVIPNCKVKLDNPDVTIIVEVCQTLCGVSVVEKCASFRNFNLAAAREGATKPDAKPI